MFIVGLFRWWYGAGFLQCARGCMMRLESALDYFSIDLLLKTMFSLFRQDGAGGVDGPLSVKIRRFFERLISRFIGAGVRFTVLIIGLFVIAGLALGSVIVLVCWGLLPLVPFAGFIMMLSGWVPWHL